jgi:hypothetical protein
VHELRAARAEPPPHTEDGTAAAAEGDDTDDDAAPHNAHAHVALGMTSADAAADAAEAAADAASARCPLEITLHGHVPIASLWTLAQALEPRGEEAMGTTAPDVDVMVLAKNVHARGVDAPLLGALRSRRVALRRLGLYDLPRSEHALADADDDVDDDDSRAHPLVAQLAVSMCAWTLHAPGGAGVSGVHVRAFSAPLAPGFGWLTQLSFADNGLSSADVAALLRALRHAAPALEALCLSGNAAGAAPACAALAALVAHAPSLREVSADGCALGDAGAAALAAGLVAGAAPGGGGGNACVALHLARNGIGDAGAARLAAALRARHQPAVRAACVLACVLACGLVSLPL